MAGPALRDLQAAFWRSIATDPGGSVPDPVLARVVADRGRLSVAERVGIYAGMYLSRLVEALREDFPQVARTLGEEAFADVVRDYLARHPSTEPSVRHVGRALPAFLAGGEPAWLADLARLEWARLDVFDSPDAMPLVLDELKRVPPAEWPALRFATVPAFLHLVTAWPVHELFSDAAAALAPRRTALRVWRQGFLVFQAPMERPEEAALDRLVAGETFAALCEAVEDPAAAAALLLRWIEDGILARAWRAQDGT